MELLAAPVAVQAVQVVLAAQVAVVGVLAQHKEVHLEAPQAAQVEHHLLVLLVQMLVTVAVQVAQLVMLLQKQAVAAAVEEVKA